MSPPATVMDVNPFSPEIVNMMLNSLSSNVVDTVYCTVPGALPQLSGRSVTLGGQEYPGLKKMTSGGFGTIYTCKHCGETKVLKVHMNTQIRKAATQPNTRPGTTFSYTYTLYTQVGFKSHTSHILGVMLYQLSYGG